MKNLILYICFFTSIIFAQNQDAEKLLDNIFEDLITKNGIAIDFDYWFENNSYKMDEPITGTVALYSDNRFYLEFYSFQNKMVQIYDGEQLYTVLMEEEEIQIDNLTENSGFFIQDIFNNYKKKFQASIKEIMQNKVIIKLTPIKTYNEHVFNNCIDELDLPRCLKLPKQCRIGIDSTSQNSLNECLEKNEGYKETNVSNVEIEINTDENKLISITQLNRYNGKTYVLIKEITTKNESYLTIDSTLYQNFEVIDLR
jgi:hypothetical protein